MRRSWIGLFFIILVAQIAMAVPLAITTLGVASSTATTATVTWTTTGTTAAADTRVSYTCGGVTNAYLDGARVTSHSATLTGLPVGVTCTYTASSQNSASETATGTVQSFSTCRPNSGQNTAVKATLYSFYAYGAFTATWHDLSGIGTTPTQCGVAITSPVSGTLDINGNLVVSLPDVNQVTPSPGAWTIAFSSFASTGSVSADISPTGQNFDASATLQGQVSAGNKGPVGGSGGVGTGTVTNVATTSPIGGGPITTTGTIACATCTTNAAALTANAIVLGAGAQATAVAASLGTTTTVLHGNAAGAPSFGAVALATDVSGQLPITAVGSAGLSGTAPLSIASTGVATCTTCTTNASALTAHGVVIGAGSQATTVTAVGSTGQVLTGNTGADPTWQAAASGSGPVYALFNCFENDASGTTHTSVNCATTVNFVSGDFYVATCSGATGSSGITITISDSLSNTWTADATFFDSGNNNRYTIAHSLITTGGASTITCTYSSATAFNFVTVNKVIGATGFDVSATNTGNAALHNSGSLVTTHNGEIAFFVEGNGGAGGETGVILPFGQLLYAPTIAGYAATAPLGKAGTYVLTTRNANTNTYGNVTATYF